METKFTPGPWSFVQSIPEHGYEGFWLENGVQTITAIDGPQNEEQEANARLIAAAPELFKAAQLVIDWFEAERDHDKAGFSERIEMCDASEAAIRAAIAKATGSQP